ncbi:MAG: universal stress protein [Bacteroidales bacterium]
MKNKDLTIVLTVLPTEKAHMLQAILSDLGVNVILEKQFIIQPVFSPGLIVRVQKKDISTILGLLDQNPGYEQTFQINREELIIPSTILVPIDFSEYSKRACLFAFNMAYKQRAAVKLLHAYFSPYFPNAFPDADNFSSEIEEGEIARELTDRVNQQVRRFTSDLKKKILSGELPDVNFEFIVREGIPEEEISRWSRQNHPQLIVMGTRGKDQKEVDLIGSVTAEVIDSSVVPVFAIPENTHVKTMSDIKRLAFVTNFDQRDLLGFQKLMNMNEFKDKEISFIYLTNKKSTNDDQVLASIRTYFQKYYPNLTATFGKINEEELLHNTDSFIREDNIDVLVLTTHKRNIFARLFNPSIAHKVVFHSDTPLLVIRN